MLAAAASMIDNVARGPRELTYAGGDIFLAVFADGRRVPWSKCATV